MPLTESLTVRILGDSSDLQRELSRVTEEVDRLEERLRDAGQAGKSFGEALGSVSTALKPLMQVSTQLDRIRLQLQALSRQPVTLNVQPALSALQQLTRAAQQAAAQLRALNLANAAAVPTMPAMPAAPAAPPIRTFNFASGGLVSGPTGIDRVPARLTAGEFVVRREIVDRVGPDWLQRLNMGVNPVSLAGRQSATTPTYSVQEALQFPDLDLPQSTAPSVPRETDRRSSHAPGVPPVIADVTQRRSASSLTSPSPSSEPGRSGKALAQLTGNTSNVTTNQFGGIEIQVRETADVPRLLQDLRHQGLSQRHRRG